MRYLFSMMFTAAIATAVCAQATQPARSALDTREWPVVYDVPASRNVRLNANVRYFGDLAIDIYTPTDANRHAKLPAVIFLNAERK